MNIRYVKYLVLLSIPLLAILAGTRVTKSQTEGWFRTGINLGQSTVRIAVPDFASRSADPRAVDLTKTFNQVLWNDLNYSGILDVVSKSLYPVNTPQEPQDVDFNGWSNPPASAQMLAFGYTETRGNSFVVTARLFDVHNPSNPGVLAKRYVADLNELSARDAAHRFANEIIQTLGGGLPGINLTKIAFVSNRTGHPEIWVMDYDGFNQHQITNYPSLNLTPRWSPDNSMLAFTSYASGNPEIYLYSLITNRRIPFPTYRGLNTTPAFSPDGKKIAFCSSMSGHPEIYLSDVNGLGLQRLTFSPGVNISPVWNPKTGNEIAFVSDRSGSPQIYIMNADGTNLRRLITAGGDAEAPSWSPNGLFIAFSWSVKETGHWDIYVIEIATGRIVQLTYNAGRNEHPSWSPDGRHIVFESTRSGKREVWTMLADGSDPHELTTAGENWNPNWSN
ncbi:MAG TPA: Tol-Pal system beta propeller repeat protein TolB [Terriglobia bacterium]|nr:Tol-Pal system beta propeller repeat protein TolB [Terriglobia bacterium]